MAARRWELFAGALGGIASWAFFASRPPMRALVGERSIDALVPAHYQASAFPAFVAFCAALALDAASRRGRRTWALRAGLLTVVSTLAAVRLAGAIPLSGHALVLAAVPAYEVLAPRDTHRWPIPSVLAAAGMAITAFYKLLVWHDAVWFVVSVALGIAIGAAFALFARREPIRSGTDCTSRR